MREESCFKLFKAVLDEQKLSIVDLENNNILSHNSFYNFNKGYPTLISCLKIANFLKVSLDYVFEKKDVNSFKKPYKIPQNFAENLAKVLNAMNLSKRKFCKEMEMSEGTFTKWRKGVQPKMSKVLDICDYLSCDIDDLLETESD